MSATPNPISPLTPNVSMKDSGQTAAPVTEVTLIEHFDDHYYKVEVDGRAHYLPSVTTKLGIIDKPFLAKWRGDIGNREADMRSYEAASKGKRIHWSWEVCLKGGVVVYDPWQRPVYSADKIAALKDEHGEVAILRTQDEMAHIKRLNEQFNILQPKVLAVEVKVYDVKNRDAGTIDHIYEIQKGQYPVAGSKLLELAGGIYVTDLKTGSSVDEEDVWLQLAPYAKMYEDLYSVKVAGALVTHSNANVRSGIAGLKTLLRTREQLFDHDYPAYRHAASLWERKHKDDMPKTFTFPSLIKLKNTPKEINPWLNPDMATSSLNQTLNS